MAVCVVFLKETKTRPHVRSSFFLISLSSCLFLFLLHLAVVSILQMESQAHKHLPEMAKYSRLDKKPVFQPQVATFAQGMVVSVPLHYSWLQAQSSGTEIHKILSEHYKDSTFIKVMPLGVHEDLLERGAFLRPDTLANTNRMELFVFANDDAEQVLLCARLDNLGKGASGAAVQNMNLALGLEESAGL